MLGAAEPERPARTFALEHVALVSAAGLVPAQTVVVAEGRIAAVGSSTRVEVPAAAARLDGSGRFLIPGLWDMHVHLAGYADGLPLFVAYGVTGVRDMGSASARETAEMLQWRREIAAGERVGPRLVVAGPTLDGERGFASDGRIYVGNAEAGRAAVAEVQRRGGDFVKIHDWVGPEAYAAIAEAAAAAGLALAGHTPAAIPARQAIASGQRSIEHLGSSLGGFLLDASSREAELRAELLERMGAARRSGSERLFWPWALGLEHQQVLLESWSAPRAEALVAELRAHGTWHCPTLTVLTPKGRTRTDAERQAIFASARATCARSAPEPAAPTAAPLFARQLEVVAALARGGVGLLAGTDTMAPSAEAIEEFGTCEVPLAGLSAHEELEWLVEAGLTPAQALEAATAAPARFLHEAATAGGFAVGMRADLVLLDANPLDDIRNTRRIHAVVADGRLFDRAALTELRRAAEASAAAH